MSAFPPSHNSRILLLSAILILAFSAGSFAREVFEIPSIWPKGSRWHRDLTEAANRIGMKTRGRVTVRFYDQTVLSELPECAIYSLPLAFKSDADLNRARSALDSTVSDLLKKRGFVVLSMQHIGNGHIFSSLPSEKSAGSLDEFLGSRLWVPKRSNSEAFSRFGVQTTVPLSTVGVQSALRNGTVTTLITTPSNAILARWHTQVSSVSKEPLMRFVAPLVLREDIYGKVNPADREIVRSVLTTAFEKAARESREKDASAVNLLSRRESISFFEFSDPAQWEKWADSVSSRLVSEGKIPATLLQALRSQTR